MLGFTILLKYIICPKFKSIYFLSISFFSKWKGKVKQTLKVASITPLVDILVAASITLLEENPRSLLLGPACTSMSIFVMFSLVGRVKKEPVVFDLHSQALLQT